MTTNHGSTTVEQTRGMDPYLAYLRVGPEAMRTARRQRQYAEHHEGTQVGAVLLGMSAEGHLAFFSGANRNLAPGTNPTKVCAEQLAAQKMLHQGFNKLIGLWVSGPPIPDKHSGYLGPTLHVCGECRHSISTNGELEGTREALFTSVHPDRDEYETYLAQEADVFHADPDNAVANHIIDPGFKRWDASVASYEDFVARPEAYPLLTPSYAARLAISNSLLGLAA